MKKLLFILLLVLIPSYAFGVTVQDAITVYSTAPQGQHNPAVASNGTSTYLVVWEQGADVQGEYYKQIYGQRVSVSGQTASTLGDVIHFSTTVYTQQLPKVVYGNGVWLVVWQDFNGTDFDIKGAIVNSNGTATPITISAETHNQITPDVTWDTTNSRFFCVWADFRGNSVYQMYGAKIVTDGTVTTTGIDSPMRSPVSGYSIYSPVVQSNATELIITWAEKELLKEGQSIKGGLFSLAGAYVSNLDIEAEVDHSYPTGQASQTPRPISIASDGTHFLMLFTAINRTNPNTVTYHHTEGLDIRSDGSMPDTAKQMAFDSHFASAWASAIYLAPYYFVFYESEPALRTSTIVTDRNIYMTRVDKTKDYDTAVVDYSSPVTISATATNAEMHPVVSKGTGGQALLVYEDDDMDPTSPVDVIKARLVDVATFDYKCAQAGVTLCNGFNDTVTDIVQGVNLWPAWDSTYRAGLDTDIKASGAGSLKFTLPSQCEANCAGSFMRSLGGSFGAGETFYVQWKQRFSPEMLTNTDLWNSSWKQVIVFEGSSSCATMEIAAHRRGINEADIPATYKSCGTGIVTDSNYVTKSSVPPYLFQHSGSASSGYNCPYGTYTEGTGNGVGCFYYTSDTWITFYLKIQIGTIGSADSSLKGWISVDGGTFLKYLNANNLTIDSASGALGEFNNIQLTQYMTGLTPVVTPTAYTWYDDLIISTQPIEAGLETTTVSSAKGITMMGGSLK